MRVHVLSTHLLMEAVREGPKRIRVCKNVRNPVGD